MGRSFLQVAAKEKVAPPLRVVQIEELHWVDLEEEEIRREVDLEEEEICRGREMGSVAETITMEKQKPHVVMIPYPAQGHVNPMLKLAKLLHFHGFHVTFVNTEFNHRRLLRSRGPTALDGFSDFRFRTIPDGLPPSDVDATQYVPSLCFSTSKTCLGPFRALLAELNDSTHYGVPPVTCVISDGVMSFGVAAAEELGIPIVLFWTTSACGFLGYLQYRRLLEEGIIPLKDESCFTNGYLDTTIDWIPGMKNIRLKDMPSFVRTTDPNDLMVEYAISETDRAFNATAIVLNTFNSLEKDVLDSLSTILPPIYTVGPLHLLVKNLPPSKLDSIGSNLWKEETKGLDWLSTKSPGSVVYANFGSVTVMTPDQLVELAWGLGNSKVQFLWVIRPDLVKGESKVITSDFIDETADRGMMLSWCPQEQVLSHPAIGGFLTHSGWNSTIESLSYGVPMVCWPFFGEQQTNCRFSCEEWGVGMEIDNDVKREEVERLVRDLMEGEIGAKMRKKAKGWKKKAEEEATLSSSSNLKKMIEEVLLSRSGP